MDMRPLGRVETWPAVVLPCFLGKGTQTVFQEPRGFHYMQAYKWVRLVNDLRRTREFLASAVINISTASSGRHRNHQISPFPRDYNDQDSTCRYPRDIATMSIL